MRIPTREKPTGRRLFRVCAVACLSATLFGGLFLFACWAATDFDPDTGGTMRELGTTLVVMMSVAVVLHYPWTPSWARASGCKTDE